MHVVLCSLKLSMWPEASNTLAGLMRGASISRMFWRLVKWVRHWVSMLRLSLVPGSPYVTKPDWPP